MLDRLSGNKGAVTLLLKTPTATLSPNEWSQIKVLRLFQQFENYTKLMRNDKWCIYEVISAITVRFSGRDVMVRRQLEYKQCAMRWEVLWKDFEQLFPPRISCWLQRLTQDSKRLFVEMMVLSNNHLFHHSGSQQNILYCLLVAT